MSSQVLAQGLQLSKRSPSPGAHPQAQGPLLSPSLSRWSRDRRTGRALRGAQEPDAHKDSGPNPDRGLRQALRQ